MPVDGKLIKDGKPPLPSLNGKPLSTYSGSFKFNNLHTFQHEIEERDKVRVQIRDIKNNKYKMKNFM